MPELPEVETMCRGIASIVGRKIQSITKPVCTFRPIKITPRPATIDQRLKGASVTQISRLGKRVLIHANNHALVLQPKMTGLVLIDSPPDPDHNRLQIDFLGKPKLRLLFWDRRGLGTVELVAEQKISQALIEGKLGPDALTIDCDDFCQRLKQTKRPIKVALLDQRLVAGVGNLYASEMLHVARISPRKPASAISRMKLNLLFEAMRDILLTAIEHEGSTLSDGTYRNALNDPGQYQNQHQVYDREGKPCPTCQTTIILRIVQAQRSTFYCPKCQR